MNGDQSQKITFFKYANYILTGVLIVFPKKFFLGTQGVFSYLFRRIFRQRGQKSEEQNVEEGKEFINKILTEQDVQFEISSQIIKKQKNLSTTQQLEVYGLYKQATEGNCNREKPSMIDVADLKQWEAWTKLSGVSQSEAQKLYSSKVQQLVQGYDDLFRAEKEQYDKIIQEQLDQKEKEHLEDDNDDEDQKQQDQSGNGGGATFLHSLRPMGIVQQDDIQIYQGVPPTEKVSQFFKYVQEQNTSKINQIVKSGYDLKSFNEKGMTPLHLSIEMDLTQSFQTLVNLSDNLNITASDGMTPLHYAVLNENQEMVHKLLELGADPDITDESGESAYDIANKSLQESMKSYKQNK